MLDAFETSQREERRLPTYTTATTKTTSAKRRAEIERRHLPEPEPYDPSKNPLVQPPEGYERNPDDPAYQPKHYWDDKPHVLRLVTDYLDWLGVRAS